MQILQNIEPVAPVLSYTLNLSSTEMGILRRAFDCVNVSEMQPEDRTPFWQIFADVVLGMN